MGHFLYHFNLEVRKNTRRLEYLYLRIIKKTYSVDFEKACFNNNINNNSDFDTQTYQCDTQMPTGYWHTNGSPNMGPTTRLYNNQPKKKKKNLQNCRIYRHRLKLKESEKKGKYLDLARKLKKKSMEHEIHVNSNCNSCS